MYSVSSSDEDEEEDLIRNLVLQEESPRKKSISKLQKQIEIEEFSDMSGEESSSEHLETFVCDLKYVFFAHNKKIGKIHDDQFLEYNRMLLNSDK